MSMLIPILLLPCFSPFPSYLRRGNPYNGFNGKHAVNVYQVNILIFFFFWKADGLFLSTLFTLWTDSRADTQRGLWIHSNVLDFVLKVNFWGTGSVPLMRLHPQGPGLPALISGGAVEVCACVHACVGGGAGPKPSAAGPTAFSKCYYCWQSLILDEVVN